MDKYYKVYDTEKHEYLHGKRVFVTVAAADRRWKMKLSKREKWLILI